MEANPYLHRTVNFVKKVIENIDPNYSPRMPSSAVTLGEFMNISSNIVLNAEIEDTLTEDMTIQQELL